jgi:uncharacterized protein (TIGR02452 family)
MDRQDLAEIAKETQLILKGGFYYAVANDVYPGDAKVTIDLSRPEGEVSSLITPIMWDDIVDCAEQYRQQQVIKLPPPKTLVQVTCETTLQAIYRTYYDGSDSRVLPIMALNFASARNPGGGWLRGADTQEESLARASDLVPSLERWPLYYRANKACGNAFYTDHAIWSPGIQFFRYQPENILVCPYRASILTIPAPNLSAMKTLDAGLINSVLTFRIRCIYAAAAHFRQRHLILGAWGCGVFANDPHQVAKIFKQELDRWSPCFTSVTFAIHDRSPDQKVYRAFEEMLA